MGIFSGCPTQSMLDMPLLSIGAASLAHHKSLISHVEGLHNSPFPTFTGTYKSLSHCL